MGNFRFPEPSPTGMNPTSGRSLGFLFLPEPNRSPRVQSWNRRRGQAQEVVGKGRAEPQKSRSRAWGGSPLKPRWDSWRHGRLTSWLQSPCTGVWGPVWLEGQGEGRELGTMDCLVCFVRPRDSKRARAATVRGEQSSFRERPREGQQTCAGGHVTGQRPRVRRDTLPLLQGTARHAGIAKTGSSGIVGQGPCGDIGVAPAGAPW